MWTYPLKPWQVHPGSQECLVRITNSQTTYSQGHSISLNSLLVSGELAFLKADIAYVETLRIQGAATNRRARLHELMWVG